MLFELFKTLEEANVSSVSGIFTYTTEIVPNLSSYILLLIFFVTASAGYFSSKRLTGTANIFANFAVASVLTTVVSIFMLMIPNLISVWIVGLCITVTIISVALLLIKDID